MMKYRILGKTGFKVSEVSLGTWQLGSKWGEAFDEKMAQNTLEAAYEQGVNFFDTADIYQNGMSEKSIGKFLKTRKDKIYVVTKCGRKLNPHVTEGYNEENITRFVFDSIHNMEVESLDLILLHCPPTEVYHNPALFEALDKLKQQGAIKHYGVSVERVDEALAALSYDISAIEIIFNMFRLKPAEELFAKAKEKNTGVIVRVPLASGLLTGKYTENTSFGKDDHRSFNRNGDFFDKGETFSGIDYLTGIKAAQELKASLHVENLSAKALRYILMYPEVSTVIPGASSPKQIIENAEASILPPFSNEEMTIVRDVYDKYIRRQIHNNW
ncbi:aldo/keto reductase [Bacteroides sp. 214]|uniref:aldo/keto reductase n=1 Tax=Bacteroides sp. 214 TaxID=2302935 RepID=UPI0013D2EB4F|nr:aldo/keto reductase [Bacteroides sp. 214]NDW12665.1 aldo/keto reductase [Bacteroides sp. 214]